MASSEHIQALRVAEAHPNHESRVVIAMTFSSRVHSLSSALITLTDPSGALISSALQKSAMASMTVLSTLFDAALPAGLV